MAAFFKTFVKGILYLFVLPVFLVVITFYGVVGLFMVLFLFVKSIVLFFSGTSLKIEMPEDEIAKGLMAPATAPISNQPAVQEERFIDEPIKNEPVVEIPYSEIKEDSNDVIKNFLEEEQIEVDDEEPSETISLDTPYVAMTPKEDEYIDFDEEDEEETESIDISYGNRR